MSDDPRPALPKKSTRGFAAMDPERQREIARKGGAAIPPEKRSFALNPELARAAGKKGGVSVKKENRSFARDPELARSAGAKGGHNAHHKTTTQEPT